MSRNLGHIFFSPIQGTWLTRLDPRPQLEGTLLWVPVKIGGAILHWPNAY